MGEALLFPRIVRSFFQRYQFGMEIHLFGVFQYLSAGPEAIEYGQLELKNNQPVCLIFAPRVFTIGVCMAVLEFVKGGKTIIGLIY